VNLLLGRLVVCVEERGVLLHCLPVRWVRSAP
jgi:hypothetical protein